jgi:hypothetical protein
VHVRQVLIVAVGVLALQVSCDGEEEAAQCGASPPLDMCCCYGDVSPDPVCKNGKWECEAPYLKLDKEDCAKQCTTPPWAIGGAAGVGGDSGASGNAGDAGDAEDGSGGVAGSSGWDSSAFPCPSQAPATSSACAPEGAVCGYDPASTNLHCGNDCAPCRDIFDCSGGVWIQRVKPAQCALGAAAACPANQPQQLELCPSAGLTCRYQDRLCYCAPCAKSAVPPNQFDPLDPPMWFCVGPPPTGCPGFMPTHGEACADDQQLCNGYEACFACGPWPAASWAVCKSGKWSTLEHGDCQT